MSIFLHFIPLIIVLIVDLCLVWKYGYPSLALLFAKCYKSRHFKWLVWNVCGNDDWFFEKINLHMKEAKWKQKK